MEVAAVEKQMRRPRFRRASEPPAFRLTDDDVDIVRQVARFRFIRSTRIAALVGRSVDRTNGRLLRLFHAGYIDRPRAQLDRFPTEGSAPITYALADRGARLLRERDGIVTPTGLLFWVLRIDCRICSSMRHSTSPRFIKIFANICYAGISQFVHSPSDFKFYPTSSAGSQRRGLRSPRSNPEIRPRFGDRRFASVRSSPLNLIFPEAAIPDCNIYR